MRKLNANHARRVSLIGGIAYGLGLAAGLIGAWFLPTWALAGLLGAVFVAWVVTRRPL